ncbi:unnamed protein product [Schistosoma turkestanicum]|nr:unnamed protein product [Schistosoma turkestanicum]
MLQGENWEFPTRLIGLVFLGVGLLLGSLIINIKKFHTASLFNAIFMMITMLILLIGIGLATPLVNWYEHDIVIFIILPLTLISIFYGIHLQNSTKTWRLVLFISCCVIILIAFAFTIINIVIARHYSQGTKSWKVSRCDIFNFSE